MSLMTDREAALWMGMKSKSAYRSIRRWVRQKKLLCLHRPDGRFLFTEELLTRSMSMLKK